ncbi:MAG: hypothetical protein KF746_07195 [Chitinophagaceae bacterium]|nr:hypothetical protein [Chitinophagaceae bacterium]
MKRSIPVLSGAVVCFFTFNAGVCKKNDTPAPPPPANNCKVIAIKSSGFVGDIVKATYNSNGTIATVFFDDADVPETRTYTYSGNTAEVRRTNSIDPTELKTITLNSDGLPVKITQDYDIGGDITQSVENFEYNGKQVTKKTLQVPFLPTQVTNYTWLNGNLVSESVQDGETTVYEYYTNRNYLSGDFMSVRHLIPFSVLSSDFVPYPFIANKNPLKSAKQGNVQVLLMDYALDANGNIKQWLMGANGVPGYIIVQQCN